MDTGRYGKDVCERKFVTYTVVRTRAIKAVQSRCKYDQHAACVERGAVVFFSSHLLVNVDDTIGFIPHE